MFSPISRVSGRIFITAIPLLVTGVLIVPFNATRRCFCDCDMGFHKKARTKIYPRTNNKVQRLEVPDSKVDWATPWEDYDPPNFTLASMAHQSWADPEIGDANFDPKWNQLDEKVNRVSHTGDYQIVNRYPRNPRGRTGLRGRGCLGRWGPNHAADPIVTRWKRDENDTPVVNHDTKLPILELVAIERSDSHEWAIPGGMVDPGEKVSLTLSREFSEEALNSLQMSAARRNQVQQSLESFFQGGIEVYKGYVDDPRNTDNAWMETVAVNFHDASGENVSMFPLNAGDDAVGVRWMDLHSGIQLYASHSEMLKKVSQLQKAHW